MNAYIVFVNGLLAGPDLFDIRSLNSSELGKYLMAEAQAKAFKNEIKTLDIFEVRASNTVARYRTEAVETKDDKVIARCSRVETTF